MTIDPCVDGCLNHNMGATTIPGAGDDPCNTNGNGYFCPGSWWSYDAAAAGGAFGDCDRLFLRTGGDCNVNQWLEVSVATMRSEIVDPVDGTDCCPSGTLWCNTATGTYWISTNGCGGDLCTWCELCKETLTDSIDGFLPVLIRDDAPPAVATVLDGPSFLALTNTTNRPMEALWIVNALEMNAVHYGANRPLLEAQIQITVDGGATWVTLASLQTAMTMAPAGAYGEFNEVSSAGVSLAQTIAPGATLTVGIRRRWWCNICPFDGQWRFAQVFQTLYGVAA